jgi:hypothetical protein
VYVTGVGDGGIVAVAVGTARAINARASRVGVAVGSAGAETRPQIAITRMIVTAETITLRRR